jgi:hypothetical protein
MAAGSSLAASQAWVTGASERSPVVVAGVQGDGVSLAGQDFRGHEPEAVS